MKTPPKPHDDLAVAAARVSRAAPNMWIEFVKAFDAYGNVFKDMCVQAAADRVFIAQGRAQQCAELSNLFLNAEKLASELAEKTK